MTLIALISARNAACFIVSSGTVVDSVSGPDRAAVTKSSVRSESLSSIQYRAAQILVDDLGRLVQGCEGSLVQLRVPVVEPHRGMGHGVSRRAGGKIE